VPAVADGLDRLRMDIGRDEHAITAYRLEGNHCDHCGHRTAGWFEESQGHWARRRRMPVRL